MKRIAIFASGSGTNAEAIMTYFEAHSTVANVALLLSNRANAFALTRAKNHGVPTMLFSKTSWADVLPRLQADNIDFIVLAGFMLLIPTEIVHHYSGRIINIHPALLPAHGGKGMYGHNVHRAVIEAREAESGITIHLVDEHYDRGQILFQARVAITATDTPDTLADKIHLLEQAHFPHVIAQTIEQQLKK